MRLAAHFGATALILLAATAGPGSVAERPTLPLSDEPFLLGGIQVNESDHQRWAAALHRAGMNAVEVTVYAHQGPWNGSKLWFASEEPAVLAEIRAARQNGLEVVLLLRVALDHNYPENRFLWHGLVFPETEAQLEEWFSIYTEFAVKWARIAQAEGVRVLGLASEMNSLGATLPVADVPELPAYYLSDAKQAELRALVGRHRHLLSDDDLAALGAGDFASLDDFLVERNRAERRWARLYSFAGADDRLQRINRRRRLLLEHWERLIATVRGVYRGHLTLAANFDNYQEVAFWNRLDLVGINAYFPLRDTAESPLSEAHLKKAWRGVFAEIEAFKAEHGLRQPVFLTELGYTRRSGVTVAPWSARGFVPIWDPSGDHVLVWSRRPEDPEERALAVRALFSAWQEDGWPFAGLLYWKLSSRRELGRHEPFMLYLGPEAGDPLYPAMRLFSASARPLLPQPRDSGDLLARWSGAVYRGDLETAVRLSGQLRNVPVPAGAEPPLHLAARFGRTALVRHLIRRGADTASRDRSGYLPLHWACYQEDPRMVSLLVPASSVSWRDEEGDTPFHKCARLDNAPVLRELLRQGRDSLRYRNGRSRTALWLAADQASAETIELLVRHRGGVDRADRNGATPLPVAAARGDPAGVELLSEVSARGARDRWGYRPVNYAAYAGRAEAFRLLWRPRSSRAADAGAQDLLHHAAHGGSTTIVEILLAHGLDPNRADRGGRTPLHYAVMQTHEAVARLLLEAGAQVERVDAVGKTALHLGAERKSTGTLQLLLARAVGLDAADDEGNTALHLAASWGYLENTRLLLAAGARTDLRNLAGQTARELAEALERHRAVELLGEWSR